MYTYIVFDVETPNRYNNRMSAIGITRITDGVITDSFFSYVNPEVPFDSFNTELTEIDATTVADAPTFHITWKKSVHYLCTVQAGRKLLPNMKHNLNVMCEHYGISLDHHKADSDSRACAEILLRYIADGADEKQFIRTYRLA